MHYNYIHVFNCYIVQYNHNINIICIYYSAQKLTGSSSPYERVHYSKSSSPRPVFVFGAKSDTIVKSMCSNSRHLKQCRTIEDILRTYSEVSELAN